MCVSVYKAPIQRVFEKYRFRECFMKSLGSLYIQRVLHPHTHTHILFFCLQIWGVFHKTLYREGLQKALRVFVHSVGAFHIQRGFAKPLYGGSFVNPLRACLQTLLQDFTNHLGGPLWGSLWGFIKTLRDSICAFAMGASLCRLCYRASWSL